MGGHRTLYCNIGCTVLQQAVSTESLNEGFGGAGIVGLPTSDGLGRTHVLEI
jgi:hypothetical protein